MSDAVFTTAELSCRFCGITGRCSEFKGFLFFTRVSSDAKPQPAGGRLAICSHCCGVQKVDDPRWRSEIAEIYSCYDIYHQSGGVESSVFSPGEGQGISRSQRLMQFLQRCAKLPAKGSFLDIGCGAGMMLRAFGEKFSAWRLAGVEINAGYRSIVEAIPGVERLHIGEARDVPGGFELVSLIHVFEHLPDLRQQLLQIRTKLGAEGVLLIDVPDYTQNPFDLLIADHCNHFSMQSLQDVLESAGFEVLEITNGWIPKEITVLARASKNPQKSHISAKSQEEAVGIVDWIAAQLEWLSNISEMARSRVSVKNFGLFGSSNAATWLIGSMPFPPQFLVDEDLARRGREAHGIKIIHPDEVPSNATVLIPLSPKQAASVFHRLSTSRSDVSWILP